MQEAIARVAAAFSITECEFFPSFPLSRLTTFRIGGPAAALAVPKTEEALLRLLALLAEAGIPRVILGNGSNVLAPDSGYRGVVVQTGALRSLSAVNGRIFAACGARLAAIAALANQEGVDGFCSLAAIPATLGGAIYMNAGAGENAIGKTVESVMAVPSEGGIPFRMLADECGFSYRKSIFQRRHLVILSAVLTGPTVPSAVLLAKTEAARTARRAAQPLELPNAGSIFRRPPGDYAGRLIEAAGLKGYRIGGAAVSPKHAGFIVNMGAATAADVRSLIAYIRMTVYERFGVCLMREIEYLGEE